MFMLVEEENFETPTENLEVSNEVKVEEKKTPVIIDEPIVLVPFEDNEPTYAEQVEALRIVIEKQNKKSSLISTISIFVLFALCIVGFLLMSINPIVSYIILGCAIVALIVLTIILKRVCNPDLKGYVKSASTLVNRHLFARQPFTDCTYDYSKKIVFSEIAEDGIYKDIKEAVSRDVVEGKYNGHSFKVAELGIYKAPVGRTKPTSFVGKYLTLLNDCHFVDRIVILSKGETEVDLPDGIEDLNKVLEDGKFSIYAPAGCKWEDVVNKKLVNKIKDIEVANHLLTLCVVIWAGRTIVYSSYDDDAITLPFNKPIDESCFDQYKNDNIALLEALTTLCED
ncbi:MAG: hypothetical protein HUJ59_02780 [Bacilli bacterium]|nr:hypothetical protein [Bacilli bacterium]